MDRWTSIRSVWLLSLLFVTVLASTSATAQESTLVLTRGSIVSREPATGAWVLELDHGVDTTVGRVRTVRLRLDERQGLARQLRVGDRLEVEGRIFGPTLSMPLANLELSRIEQLEDPGLRHAYFLFRSGKSEGCEECYIPLLLTAEPIGASAMAEGAAVIVTFERDSIWEIPDKGGVITEVEPRARTLRLDGKPYRYQEIALEAPIRLLTNPLSSLPISRPWLPNAPTETRLRALLIRLGVHLP